MRTRFLERLRAQTAARRARINIGILVLLGTAAPAFGWGADGHRVTGAIAEARLGEPAKAAVREILGTQTLAQASTWADEIKSDGRYDWAKPLHYVNLPRGQSLFVMDRDCGKRVCVVAAIEDYTAKLESPGTPREQRIEALRFLIHFVGDIHQPLHAGFSDDRGGNRLEVEFFGRRSNLHKVWDSDMIDHQRVPWSEYAVRLAAGITEEKAATWRAVTDPAAWANESAAIVQSIVYRAEHTIGEPYLRGCMPVVDERLQMAGVRLADLLDRIFVSERPLPEGEAPGPLAGEAPRPAPGIGSAEPGAAGAGTTATGERVSIVMEGECGEAGGEQAFLVNGDPSTTFEVRVRQTFTVEGKSTTRERSITVPAGERRSLGCSERSVRGGETGTLAWEIVSAAPK